MNIEDKIRKLRKLQDFTDIKEDVRKLELEIEIIKEEMKKKLIEIEEAGEYVGTLLQEFGLLKEAHDNDIELRNMLYLELNRLGEVE